MKILFFLLILSVVYFGCKSNSRSNIKNDSTFAFHLEDDWDMIIVDTFNDTVTVNYPSGKKILIKLKLNQEEIESIRKEMERIKIMEYPIKFKPVSGDTGANSNYIIMPHPKYYLKVRMDSIIKEIYWDDVNKSKTINARRLRNLIFKIESIIKQKYIYKNLPKQKIIHM